MSLVVITNATPYCVRLGLGEKQIDAFMKASVRKNKRQSVMTDYIMRMLGLEVGICRNAPSHLMLPKYQRACSSGWMQSPILGNRPALRGLHPAGKASCTWVAKI